MMDDIDITPETKKKGKKSKAEIELDKMLDEARTADEELAKKEACKPVEVQPKPEVKQEEPKQNQPRGDFLKWFFVGLIIVSLVGGYLLYTQLHKNIDETPSIGLAVYNPEKWLNDWNLDVEKTNLAEMPADFRAEMMSQGITDAATWEFSKGTEKLFFWTRIFADNATRDKYDGAFNGPLVWRNGARASMAIGDEGIIGIYRMEGNDPLMIYTSRANQIWYISYYNYANENGSAYNATEMTADKQNLVDMARQFYDSFQSA